MAVNKKPVIRATPGLRLYGIRIADTACLVHVGRQMHVWKRTNTPALLFMFLLTKALSQSQ